MYRTDFHDRNRMVPQLLEHANLTSDVPCFNISSFADTLDVIRQRIEDGVFDVELLNPHIRPERMYFDHIRWGLVLKTADLSDAEKVRPIVERLPYRKFVKNGASHLHESTGPEIVMPASTAKKLADFAALTRERPRRR